MSIPISLKTILVCYIFLINHWYYNISIRKHASKSENKPFVGNRQPTTLKPGKKQMRSAVTEDWQNEQSY